MHQCSSERPAFPLHECLVDRRWRQSELGDFGLLLSSPLGRPVRVSSLVDAARRLRSRDSGRLAAAGRLRKVLGRPEAQTASNPHPIPPATLFADPAATTDNASMVFVIKAEVPNPRAKTFTFIGQKTMYGGKRIAAGDTVYIFASENEGGVGLVARGLIVTVEAVPRMPGVQRQTPRVSVVVQRTGLAKRPLGRAQLKAFAGCTDARPESELHFKFYRQATNKIAGVSDATAAFLDGFFSPLAFKSRPAGIQGGWWSDERVQSPEPSNAVERLPAGSVPRPR